MKLHKGKTNTFMEEFSFRTDHKLA